MSRPLDRATVAGLVLAPAAWAATIVAGWVLVHVACSTGAGAILHGFAGAMLAVAAAGLAAALRARRADDEDVGAAIGVLLSGFFLLGILVAWAYLVVLDPCASTP